MEFQFGIEHEDIEGQTTIYDFLFDPGTVAEAEALFEDAMRPHQEQDGSYACDPHVMLSYAIVALRTAAETNHEEGTDGQGQDTTTPERRD